MFYVFLYKTQLCCFSIFFIKEHRVLFPPRETTKPSIVLRQQAQPKNNETKENEPEKKGNEPNRKNICKAGKNVSAGDDVIKILYWNTEWLMQQANRSYSPPVTKDTAIQMPKTFDDYKHYHRVVNPLLMMELWNYVYKDFSTQSNE